MSDRPTASSLAAAAKAAGISIPRAQQKPILAGATWLRNCVVLLEKAGLGK